MTNRPHVLVLTGSIGMGKTTTAQMFADLGVPTWDADTAVARLYGKNGAAVWKVETLVPVAIKNGAVDRSILRAAIAEDPKLLDRLEALIHPMVAKDREVFVEGHLNADLVLLDIPLYFETGAKFKPDKVIVVTAPEDIQRDRVLARGTMSEDEFELIKSRQMPDAEKRAKADIVIETLTLEGTRTDVQTLVEQLRSET